MRVYSERTHNLRTPTARIYPTLTFTVGKKPEIKEVDMGSTHKRIKIGGLLWNSLVLFPSPSFSVRTY